MKTPYSLLVMIAGLSLSGPACHSGPEHLPARMNIDYDGQIDRLTEAVEADSTNADLLAQLGRLYLDKAFSRLYRSRSYQNGWGRYYALDARQKESILLIASTGYAVLLRALRLDYRRADVHRALGDYYLNVYSVRSWYPYGDSYLTKAVECYSASLAFDSTSVVAFRQLGLLSSLMADYGKAISHLKKAVAMDPSNGGGWLLLGEAYHRSGDRTAAWDAYHKAVACGFDTAEDYLHMASVYGADDVQIVFHKSIQDIPASIKSYFNLGVEWFRTNPHRKAIELCKSALSMDSAFYSVYPILAEEYFAAADTANAVWAGLRCFAPEDTQKAVLNFINISPNRWYLLNYEPALVKRMIAADPTNPRLWYAVAAYRGMYEPSSMVEAYEKVATLDPDFPGISAALGSAYLQRRDTLKAAHFFERAYERREDTVAGWFGWHGMVDFYLGRNDRARVLGTFRRQAERQPTYLWSSSMEDSTIERLWLQGRTDSTIYIAWAYCLLGQELADRVYSDTLNHADYLPDALEAYKTALNVSPAFIPAHYGMGSVLAQKGDLSSAIRSYQTGLRADPDNAFIHAQLGSVLEQNGQHAAAVASFRKSLALEPDPRWWYAGHYGSYGRACAAVGNLDEAIGAFEKSLELCPDDPGTRYDAGVAYERKGNWEKATVNFERAAKLGNKAAAAKLHMASE